MASSSAGGRVLLLENVHASARDILTQEKLSVETHAGALSENELCDRIRDVRVLGIRSKTQVNKRVLDAAENLVSIGAFCIGTNQIDLAYAKDRGIAVFNAPFSNTRSVAELIIAEVVMLARQLGDRSREVHEGKWRKIATQCYEIRGKTLGIVGYGHIGSQVGVLAEGMGMRVLSYDVRTTLPMGNVRATETIDELLGASDFVTVHVPETPLTKNMIAERELSKMKKGAYLLNASRGTVVVIPALRDALSSGHLAGAAIDVYPQEPESNSDGFRTELAGLPNTILTPHIGGSTAEAQAAIGREVAVSLSRFWATGTTTGSVNFPSVELAMKPGAHRVVNVHKNVPGVLRDVNRIVSERNANIDAQILATDPAIGYLLMDVDATVSADILRDISALPTSLRTRLIQ